jgi:TRAP-type C4-dicarboxylate transport system substrate-binding protein
MKLRIVVLSALFALAGTRTAEAQKVKLGTLAPKGSPWFDGVKKTGERWEKASGGKVELRIYPGGVAGDEGDMLRKINIGQLHAATITMVGLSKITRTTVGLQVPMMFRSYDELDYVRERIGPRLEKELEAGGYVVLNWGDAGMVHFFTTKKAVTPDELKKLKLFVWAGDPEAKKAWDSAGFDTIPMSSTDVLAGLQTGMVEAFATAPVYALTSQWFGLAKHMVAINWTPLNGATVISKERWNEIPADLRPELMKIAKEEGAAVRDRIRTLGARSIEEMKKRGLTIHVVDAAGTAQWQKTAELAYPVIRGEVVPTDVFDEVKRLTEEFRKKKP